MQETVTELLKEASMLGNVRHPNIVWVYGLVIPPLEDKVQHLKDQLPAGMSIDAVNIATSVANKYVLHEPVLLLVFCVRVSTLDLFACVPLAKQQLTCM